MVKHCLDGSLGAGSTDLIIHPDEFWLAGQMFNLLK